MNLAVLDNLAGIADALYCRKKRSKKAAAQTVGRGNAQLATLGKKSFIHLQPGFKTHDMGKNLGRGF